MTRITPDSEAQARLAKMLDTVKVRGSVRQWFDEFAAANLPDLEPEMRPRLEFDDSRPPEKPRDNLGRPASVHRNDVLPLRNVDEEP